MKDKVRLKKRKFKRMRRGCFSSKSSQIHAFEGLRGDQRQAGVGQALHVLDPHFGVKGSGVLEDLETQFRDAVGVREYTTYFLIRGHLLTGSDKYFLEAGVYGEVFSMLDNNCAAQALDKSNTPYFTIKD
jgi:hypothetical protein